MQKYCLVEPLHYCRILTLLKEPHGPGATETATWQATYLLVCCCSRSLCCLTELTSCIGKCLKWLTGHFSKQKCQILVPFLAYYGVILWLCIYQNICFDKGQASCFSNTCLRLTRPELSENFMYIFKKARIGLKFTKQKSIRPVSARSHSKGQNSANFKPFGQKKFLA